MQGLCSRRPEPAPLAGQALLLLCGAPRRSSPRQRSEGTGMRKCKCAAWRVPGRCWVREAAEGCDRKAKGVRGWHGDLAPRGDSPEKTLPVLPEMVARYWTRCWQLVVLPLPLAPSSTTAWSWRLISMLR